MTIRYHLKDDGTPAVCKAQEGNCPKTLEDGSSAPHFESKEAAREHFEKSMEKESTPKSKQKPIRYSFLKHFKEQEKIFNESFEGVPNRFFNADLRGKALANSHVNMSADDLIVMTAANIAEGNHTGNTWKIDGSRLSNRMFNSMSAPVDMSATDEAIRETADRLGADSIEELDKDEIYKAGSNDRAYLMTFKDKDGNNKYVIIADKAKGELDRYRFRYSGLKGMNGERTFLRTNIRTFIGAGRVHKKTGGNPLKNIATSNGRTVDRSHSAFVSVTVLKKLEEAQEEGKNFKNQKRFVRDSNGKVATVWDDKKNPNPIHEELAKKTSLTNDFAKIEIDNDVDPAEFNDFEEDFNDVKSKLPKIPGDRQPELRIRKLGKHGSANKTVHGMYNPVKNAIAVDVRNSASTIHEMGHYYDLAVKGNSSLSQEAQPLVNRYRTGLTTYDEKEREYLSTPTEVYARAFEMYSHERLGINNRLLNPEKFDKDSESFGPFYKDPTLKEDFFNFFDKSFGN